MKKIPLIVIAGPTASGKTAVSVELAKLFNGEIVSADSMQIYKDMNIGTAKPSEEEKQGIVHHLMDFLEPDKPYSVADYVNDAHNRIRDIVSRGRLPIVVGGTGLYISSLVSDVDFNDGASDEKIRQELNELAKREGAQKLLDILKEFDPVAAQTHHPSNLRRIIRAIEFYRVTGKTITQHNEESKQKESRYKALVMAIDWEREALYERIDRRVDIMMEEGLLDEVFVLVRRGYTKKMQSMQGIGYKQLLDYYRGFSTLNEAVNIIKRDSRRYAKRQITWFKRTPDIRMISAKGDILKQASEYTREFLAENQQIFTNI